MPSDENRIKEYCQNATKYTNIFKDLLASGDPLSEEIEDEDQEEDKQEQENEEGKEEG